LGEQTTLGIATTGKDSLRTIVPMSIIKHFKLIAGDKLDWDFFVKDGEIVLIVRPLKDSSGNI
jgi:hypothetical protein